jgi:hypothetical protein
MFLLSGVMSQCRAVGCATSVAAYASFALLIKQLSKFALISLYAYSKNTVFWDGFTAVSAMDVFWDFVTKDVYNSANKIN